MAETDRPTVQDVLQEFGGDAEALAVEVLALRRVVEELRSLLGSEPRGPFVIVSPPSEPRRPDPEPEPWRVVPPRMATS
jgi:hypothetical protein